MKFLKSVLLAGALAAMAPTANATVVTFEDAPQGQLADGYGGIIWGGEWYNYNNPQPPYTPFSGENRIYDVLPGDFSFLAPVVFNGAYVAGNGPSSGPYLPVSFELYLSNVLVFTSAALGATATPTFLATNYSGLVDRVVVNGTTDFFVLDDVTYNEKISDVPVPAALPLLLTGIGGVVTASRLRRRKKKTV